MFGCTALGNDCVNESRFMAVLIKLLASLPDLNLNTILHSANITAEVTGQQLH